MTASHASRQKNFISFPRERRLPVLFYVIVID
jgi:hypothetical protein